MKHLLATLVVATCLGGVSTAHAASASPVPVASSPTITLVSGGCGPGGFRDRFGYCRPRPVYRRFCPPRPPHDPVRLPPELLAGCFGIGTVH